jgi:RimJ/RimL family protein N-acetyltransferase
MTGPMIETERLILRPYVEGDLEGLHAIWSDPESVKFIAAGPSTPQQSWFRLLRAVGMWSVKGYGPFAILDRTKGRFLGEAGFADWRRGLGERFDPFPETGWLLARHVHGRGFGTEAVVAVHRWLDASRPETRSVCIIDPDNTPSLRIAERVGYRPFGQSKIGDNDVIMFGRDRSD